MNTKERMRFWTDLYFHLDEVIPQYIDETDVLDYNILLTHRDTSNKIFVVVHHKSENGRPKYASVEDLFQNYPLEIVFKKDSFKPTSLVALS